MRSRRVVDVLAGLVVLAGLTAAAPPSTAHPLVGKWNIEYERGRRMMNGEAEVITGKAVLEISEKGDELAATLTPEAQGGNAPKPLQLTGKPAGNGATFKGTSSSTVNLNGEERTINVTMTWELKADGDNLSGTSKREMADMPMVAQPAPVKGTRAKG